jgi:predicted PhzF superfamily epimerase YddE/YHI9
LKLGLFQADAFTDKLFGGNPAAIIALRKGQPFSEFWIND